MPIIIDKTGEDNTLKGSAEKDLFVFRLERETYVTYDFDYGMVTLVHVRRDARSDEIRDFTVTDKIRIVDFNGDFADLTFQVDSDEGTITIGYGDLGDRIILRNVGDLIDDNGNHLLTVENFHFVPTEVSEGGETTDGDDVLKGVWEAVTLRGGKGDDVLEGGWENDTLKGGKGFDILYGSWGDDTLKGGKGDDVLYGGWGDDILYGGKGDDVLEGSWGDDELYGGKGKDTLEASWGDVLMDGGKGNDTMEGGWGADTFVFREGDGQDTIVNFGFGFSGSDGYFPTPEERTAAENGARRDVIQLHLRNVWDDTSDETAFKALNIRQDGSDTVISYGSAGDTITLEKVKANSLTIEDFDFFITG